MYAFVGFDIAKDNRMLKNSELEINLDNFIDMQRKWRHPYTNKAYDSLAYIAGMVVHPFYKNMKYKINHNEDHKLWGISPLPDYLIEYATIDAYATYQSWKKIDMVKKVQCKLNYKKEFGRFYGY
ncbi:hypothetical protein ZWY2020_035853 [Hordeum vulgare]|nr:hypothetical protein ZWY2020_035853 [Hordeum vulgare]